MRTSRLCSLWPDMRPLRFRRVPFGRDVAFDPGGATASRIAMPHMLPSTVPSVSASAKLLLSWLNPPPHPITVYASHPPSPTTAQHSLPGGALPPYRGRSFTGRIASASPDAPKPSAQRHLGCCENRSGDHGCLPPTGGTLVKRPGLDEAVIALRKPGRQSRMASVSASPPPGTDPLGVTAAETRKPNEKMPAVAPRSPPEIVEYALASRGSTVSSALLESSARAAL